jgi:hypothetical protein
MRPIHSPTCCQQATSSRPPGSSPSATTAVRRLSPLPQQHWAYVLVVLSGLAPRKLLQHTQHSCTQNLSKGAIQHAHARTSNTSAIQQQHSIPLLPSWYIMHTPPAHIRQPCVEHTGCNSYTINHAQNQAPVHTHKPTHACANPAMKRCGNAILPQ